MAKQSLQEKFQITGPPNKNDDDEGRGWEWFKQGAQKTRPVSGGYLDGLISDFALGPKPFQSMEVPKGGRMKAVQMSAAGNDPPTWTDMQEFVMHQHGGMPLVTASDSDVTNDMMQAKDLRDGFSLYALDGADDQYTGEGVDHFYGVATGEDDAGNKVEGFCERNNYLDRE